MVRQALIAILVAGCSNGALQAVADPVFERSATQVTGPRSGVLVLADLNRDGHADLIVQHLLDRKVAVHLNRGAGDFEDALVLDHVLEPGTIAVGQLNGDGFPDLVIAAKNHSTHAEFVHVLLGDGKGRFSPASAAGYGVGQSVEGYKPVLRLADLNDDGTIDIIVANARRNSIEVLLATRDGQFQPARSLSLPAGPYRSFALSDMDGDDHLDLVFASEGAEGAPDLLAVSSGDGLGGFGPARTIDTPILRGPRLLAVEDVDRDNQPDMILGYTDTPRMSILRNLGGGRFAAISGSPFTLSAQAFSVALQDANGDQVPDIFAATGDSISILMSSGDSYSAAPGSPYPAGPGAYNIAAGDLNGDGRTDVLASSFEGASATLMTAS